MVHLKAFGAEAVITRSDVEKGHPAYYVPIVMDGDAFVGLVTRTDVLSHLRRRRP